MNANLGICLIGAGRAGMIHARNFAFRLPGARVTAVCDVQTENARAAADELGASWHTDFHAALDRPDVDAVVIVTPTRRHRDVALAAAHAKKHIFCEKPLAIDAPSCVEMIRAAARNGVILQVGFMRRFDAGFCRAREIIESGAIGDVVCVKSLTRGPSTPRAWMYDLAESNGPLAEVNSHDIDTVRWLTGSEVGAVHAFAGNYRCEEARRSHPDFYDTVLMNLRMENQMLGGVEGAQGVQYGYDARVDVLGTKGSVQAGGLRETNTLLYTREGGLRGDVAGSWTTLFADAYLREDAAFLACVREGRPPEVSGEDGLRAVETVEAGNRSIATGGVVTPQRAAL